ncbi:MAG TPA: hypothetical protein VGN44_18670 [Candidatus Angelobacter sp.]|jgi:hypothetical protein
MVVASTPSMAKSGAHTELPEDHYLDSEDPEDYRQKDEEENEEPAANL